MADRPIVSPSHVLGNIFALHTTSARARSSCRGRFSIIIRPILASKSRVVMEAAMSKGKSMKKETKKPKKKR